MGNCAAKTTTPMQIPGQDESNRKVQFNVNTNKQERLSVRSTSPTAIVIRESSDGSERDIVYTPRTKSFQRSSIRSQYSRNSLESLNSTSEGQVDSSTVPPDTKDPTNVEKQRIPTRVRTASELAPSQVEMQTKKPSFKHRAASFLLSPKPLLRSKSETKRKEEFAFEVYELDEHEFALAMMTRTPTTDKWKSLRNLNINENTEDENEEEEAEIGEDGAVEDKSARMAKQMSRGALMKRSLFHRSKSISVEAAFNTMEKIHVTEKMVELEALISDPLMRRKLIQEMLVLRGNWSTKVRFIAAVDQYVSMDEENKEKSHMGRKIVSIFVKDESGMFSVHLKETTARYVQMMGFQEKFLPYARLEVLEEIAQNSELEDILYKLTREEGKRKHLFKAVSLVSMPKKALESSKVPSPVETKT